ncbi:MAG TPA: cytochrome c biogenesis protein CcdA [Anaerolineae bacterium]|nr:cytochrome c biogenesis protein CcdA [Anaerolineae bacterium]
MNETTSQNSAGNKSGRYQITCRSQWKLVASFIIPVLIVVAILTLLLGVRDGAETAMANLATLLPVGYAFGAGMVASVNPCGFFLLPSYISYNLGTEEEGFYDASPLSRLTKALILGAIATAGFIVVFAIAGTLISAGGQWLVRVFPFAGVAIGGVMMLLGLYLLITRRTLGIMAASRVTVSRERNSRNVFMFGIAYAIGSLSCTLPIFLVVVGGSLASQGLVASFSQFVSYALGMGAILVAVTIGSAMFQGSVAKSLRQLMPYVHRISALFLVAAGAYLIYYWIFFAGLTF